jgi:hypothetical protein
MNGEQLYVKHTCDLGNLSAGKAPVSKGANLTPRSMVENIVPS